MYQNEAPAPAYYPNLGSIQGSAAIPRAGHVTSQMERAQKLTEQLAANLKELDSRLQPILRSSQSPQAGKGEANAPKPVLVGHAQGLSNHNDQIETAVSFVESILDRIEL